MSSLTATQMSEIRNRKLTFNYYHRQYLALTAPAIALKRKVSASTVRKIENGQKMTRVAPDLVREIRADLAERDQLKAKRDEHSMEVVAKEYGKTKSTTFNLVSDLPSATLDEVLVELKPHNADEKPEKRAKPMATIRKLKPEQIKAPLEVPDNVQAKWLTRAWREAA